MKPLATIVALLLVTYVSVYAQQKTIETTTTVDSSAAGKTTSTQTSTKVIQEVDVPRNNMITINPLKFFIFYNLSFYHALSDVVVIGGGAQVPTLSAIGGFGLNAEARFHPSARRMRGFYVAPNISFNTLNSSSSSQDETATAFSIGVLLGWQWFPGDDFAMGLGLGVDKYFLSASNSSGTVDIFNAFNGVTPAFRFDIGYAW
ncbi:MAG: hypothetical protein SGJ05_04010 [bacterium]|nr:hypothetical protein [bacterium]